MHLVFQMNGGQNFLKQKYTVHFVPFHLCMLINNWMLSTFSSRKFKATLFFYFSFTSDLHFVFKLKRWWHIL